MLVGFLTTVVYMVGSRFYGMSWFGTTTIASGVFGIPLGFLTIWVVSLMTDAPSKEIQDLVTSVRYPKSGQAITAPPDITGRGAAAH